MNRVDALVEAFGADTETAAGQSKLLPTLAKEVVHEYLRPGGGSSYARYGRDVISAAEIVQKVYETWLNAEHVTVEWFETRDNPRAMLRTFCRTAAQNIVNQNIDGTRKGWREGSMVQPTSMIGNVTPGEDAREAFVNPGASKGDSLSWLTNSEQFVSDLGNPEADHQEAAVLDHLSDLVADLIESIPSDAQREVAGLYYLDGLEVDEAAAQAGLKREAGKKALQRARANLGEQDAAALVAWRRAMFPGSGRQPLAASIVPEAFAKALA